ncbi:MAG: hypothetical protein HQL94_00515 [Magnetococcales bacterium]|nr:hypothetical protein [Magnetococcales bacterium]
MKKRIWCAVSGHGFGHLSQVAPILNELTKRIPDLRIHLTGNIPTALIQKLLNGPFTHDPQNRDVGLIHDDPLIVNLTKTSQALRELHHNWPSRIQDETKLMSDWSPDLILGDIPYLPMEAGYPLGVPTVAISSLTWDQVVMAYFPPEKPESQQWLQTMQQGYAKTTLALLATPALPHNPFPNTIPIAPITTLGQPRTDELRDTLKIAPQDHRPLILITLGGIPTHNLPIAAMQADDSFHWLVDSAIPPTHHIHPLSTVQHWPFQDLTASVNGILSKPGYGMAIAATAHQIPFLYVKRGTFPDETPISHWSEHHGRAMELSQAAFQQGDFGTPLRQLMQRTPPPAPQVNGASVAADILIRQFL